VVGLLARRSFHEIVYDILKMEGRKKTHIMYGTGLTYPQTVRYLGLLIDHELLAVETDPEGRDIYRVTPKGRDLLNHLSVAIGYLGREF
jgi:predicted transcriptional regulator